MMRLTKRMKPIIMISLIMMVAMAMVFAAGQKEAAADAPIKLAGMYNLTGGFSSIDAPGLNGAQLQAKLINEAGGVLGGRMIEVVGYDTQSDQLAAATQAKRALDQGVIAGLGYGDTTFVMAAAPLFQSAGLLFVTSGATHPELPKWVGDMFFMVPFGDDDQSFAIAEFAWEDLNDRKLVVWNDDSMDFTLALSKFFKQRFNELGGTIVHEVFFQTGDTDFSANIARLRDSGADAVFVGSIPNEAGLTVKQIREAGIDMPIISADGYDTELVATVPGPQLANDVYFSTHTYRNDDRPEVTRFVEAYREEFDRDTENGFAALGFDAVGLIPGRLCLKQPNTRW